MKFIGIDLGWSSGASGLCCLNWENNQLQFIECDRQQSLNDILTWIDTKISPTSAAIIAVDAPTIIANPRECAKPMINSPTNTSGATTQAAIPPSPFAQKTVEFGLSLESRGFVHAPTIEAQKLGRYQIEVFPHPATINLFKLDRILKYKKGKLAERQLELMKLCQYIRDILPTLEPSLNLANIPKQNPPSSAFICGSNLPEIPTSIATLKALEDKLDALLCAYIGAHWWYWGIERNLVLGDRTTGYINIPQLR